MPARPAHQASFGPLYLHVWRDVLGFRAPNELLLGAWVLIGLAKAALIEPQHVLRSGLRTGIARRHGLVFGRIRRRRRRRRHVRRRRRCLRCLRLSAGRARCLSRVRCRIRREDPCMPPRRETGRRNEKMHRERGQKIEESALPESEALVVVLSGVSLHFRLGRAEPMIVGYDLRKTAEMAIN